MDEYSKGDAERRLTWDKEANDRKVRGDRVIETKTKCFEVDSELKFDVLGSRRQIFNLPGKPEWMSSERFVELCTSDICLPPGPSSSWVAVKPSARTSVGVTHSTVTAGDATDSDRDQLPPFLFTARTTALIGEEDAHRLASLLEELPGSIRDNSARGSLLIDIIDPNAFPLDTASLYSSSSSTQLPLVIRQQKAENSSESETPLRYRWLPSDVSVRNNRAFFASEISGLQGFEFLRDSDLIPLLELSFTRMLPMFETVLGQSFLPDADLQVIVKCQSYQLPGQASYSGEFHREGPLEEHIKAVGLLYLNIDSRLEGGALDLKLIVQGGCIGTSVRDESVNTHSGLSLVFRNDKVFHRMATLTNTSSAESPPASRTVLGLFLIDPDVRVPSTAQHPTQKDVSQFLLPPLMNAFKGVLPLVALVRSYAGLIMTDAQSVIRDNMITERRRPSPSPESFIRGGRMD